MDDIRRTVIDAFAEARGVEPEELDLEWELDDDGDEEVITGLCARLGIDPRAIWPPERSPPNGWTIAGLRRLAPLSVCAAERLHEMRLRWEVWSIEGVVRSLEARRHVGTGHWREVEHNPIPPASAALRYLAWIVLPATPLSLLTWASCNPVCRFCPTLTEAATSTSLPILFAVVTLAHLASLGSAWRELRREPEGLTDAAT